VTGTWQYFGHTCRHHLWYGCSWVLPLSEPQFLTNLYAVISYENVFNYVIQGPYFILWFSCLMSCSTFVGGQLSGMWPYNKPASKKWWLMVLWCTNEQNNDNNNYYRQGDNADVSSLKQERIVSQYYMAVRAAVAEFFATILTSEPPNTVEQSPSWKANSHVLLNQKVQCYVHRSSPLVLGWSQMFHLNIIPPPILYFPSDLPALCFLTNSCYFFSPLHFAFVPFPLTESR